MTELIISIYINMTSLIFLSPGTVLLCLEELSVTGLSFRSDTWRSPCSYFGGLWELMHIANQLIQGGIYLIHSEKSHF